MKVRVNHISALLCAFALSIGLFIPAGAINMDHVVTPQASDQLAYYAAYAVTSSGGKVIIEFEVDGTRRMDLVGASYIVVQEKTGGKWMGVSTYFGSVANGMLGDNTFSHMGSITYKGTVGKEYRALVTVYAENSIGDDSRIVTTNSVIAQ